MIRVGQLNRSMSYDYDQIDIPPAPVYNPNLTISVETIQ